jgi:hypothetical protein
VDKHPNLAVAAGHSLNAAGWRQVSALVLDRFAGRFTRVEPRRAAAGFVTGLLADLEVKTSWQLAEHAGHDRPDAMQRLLFRAKWDADAVRDDVRQVVIDRLGDPDGVLVVDETGDLKKGVHTVGVQRWAIYCPEFRHRGAAGPARRRLGRARRLPTCARCADEDLPARTADGQHRGVDLI